jgi:hypothetical protein
MPAAMHRASSRSIRRITLRVPGRTGALAELDRGAPKQTRAKLCWSIARVYLLAFAIALHLRCLSALSRFEGAASNRESRECRREPVFVFCGSAIARR